MYQLNESDDTFSCAHMLTSPQPVIFLSKMFVRKFVFYVAAVEKFFFEDTRGFLLYSQRFCFFWYCVETWTRVVEWNGRPTIWNLIWSQLYIVNACLIVIICAGTKCLSPVFTSTTMNKKQLIFITLFPHDSRQMTSFVWLNDFLWDDMRTRKKLFHFESPLPRKSISNPRISNKHNAHASISHDTYYWFTTAHCNAFWSQLYQFDWTFHLFQ